VKEEEPTKHGRATRAFQCPLVPIVSCAHVTPSAEGEPFAELRVKIGDHPDIGEEKEDNAASAALTDGRRQRAERSGVLLIPSFRTRLLLCLLLRSLWLTVEGGGHGATGVLHRRGGRAALAVSVSMGWWRSNSQLSPCRQTSEFSGGCRGLAPPARRLVLVLLDTEVEVATGFRNPWTSSIRVGGPPTADGFRVVGAFGSACAGGGPRFVTEQVRALDHLAPRWWRPAGGPRLSRS
jgi:hypothetical protein